MQWDAASQAIGIGAPSSALFATWIWLLRRVATGKIVPGKIHEDRVADADKRAEIYKEMAHTSLDALREQGQHTVTALIEIKAMLSRGLP